MRKYGTPKSLVIDVVKFSNMRGLRDVARSENLGGKL